jgi:hypothetical protein
MRNMTSCKGRRLLLVFLLNEQPDSILCFVMKRRMALFMRDFLSQPLSVG